MVKRKVLDQVIFETMEEAKRYDKHSRTGMRYHARRVVSAVKRLWGITEGKVLDVGTGPGNLAIEFAKTLPDAEVVAIDLSDAVLELARENAKQSEMHSTISFRKGDAEDLPLDDGTIDLVVSSFTLHLLDNPVRLLDEVQRVLTPGGRFLISDFKRTWLGLFTRPIRASYSLKEVKEIASKSNLQNWKVQRIFYVWLAIMSKE